MTDTYINGGNRRRIQQVRVKATGWTKKRRIAFLGALAETCNVRLSTERAGMRGTSAYDLRRRDAEFARLWDEALDTGYQRLETLLLQRAIEGINDIEVPVPDDDRVSDQGTAPAEGDPARGHRRPGSGIAPGMARTDVQLALALLNRRNPTGLAKGGRKAMTSVEVDALLARKLDMLARQRGGAA